MCKINRIFGIVMVVVLTGCGAHVHHLPKAEPNKVYFAPLLDKDELLIGVALSGGGSRAATFGAAGIKALAKLRDEETGRSVMEQVSHISSVSGGGLAASYFAMKKPEQSVPMLSSDGSFTPQYNTFFTEYMNTMTYNYQRAFEIRQVLKNRWFDPSKRATSLSETLDANYLNEGTLTNLYEREKAGDSPRLIINTTFYNNGRRMVITTLPSEAFSYNVIRKLKEQAGNPASLPTSLNHAEQYLTPFTFEGMNVNPTSMPLSQAVTASASFPPVIGPLTVQVDGSEKYWHIGDGGLFENQGVESLTQVFLKKLEENGTPKRALILVLDSSFPFSLGESPLDHQKKGYKVYIKSPTRIVGIQEERANAYRSLFWNSLQTEGNLVPKNDRIKIIVLKHIEANLRPEELPDACIPKAFPDRNVSPAAITEYISRIPTLFKVSSCDRQLLEIAASRVVEQRRDEILAFINQP